MAKKQSMTVGELAHQLQGAGVNPAKVSLVANADSVDDALRVLEGHRYRNTLRKARKLLNGEPLKPRSTPAATGPYDSQGVGQLRKQVEAQGGRLEALEKQVEGMAQQLAAQAQQQPKPEAEAQAGSQSSRK